MHTAVADSVQSSQVEAALLETTNLECMRHDRTLFQDLNLNVVAGHIVQIEGANGSGKTSLLRMLCGLLLPSEGEVRWRGTDIQVSRTEFLTEVSYIGHAPGIKEELTPAENLCMSVALAQPREAITVPEALERVGLFGFEDLPVCTLSAGQRRRVALARLLLTEATLWVLDEPFTSLDKLGRTLIQSLLEEHSQRGGAAVLTTHQEVHLPNCSMQTVQLTP
jgi:heme exporter protein A